MTQAPAALLCDADGNLFPSEEPAFAASAEVTNRFLRAFGIEQSYSADELRRAASGRNFRRIAADLAREHGVEVDPDADLGPWVDEERRCVSEHLERALRPDPEVREPLLRLAERYELALVSSSALSRLDVCLRATGLDDLFPDSRRFSAEDSLAEPTSKPDPAIYVHAASQLGIAPDRGLAVEDAVSGVQSAVAAGCPTVGLVMFVPEAEREARVTALRGAGAETVVRSWGELAEHAL